MENLQNQSDDRGISIDIKVLESHSGEVNQKMPLLRCFGHVKAGKMAI